MADELATVLEMHRAILVEADEYPELVREDLPTRIEHDFIRMSFDRTIRHLEHVAEYLDGQYQYTKARESRALAKSLDTARSLIVQNDAREKS